jgi:hypothetical protein
MKSRKDLLEELNWTTEKISSQVWILNLGILGTTWSLLISRADPDKSAAKFNISFFEARWIIVLCLLGLLCDMGQYLSAYLLSDKIRKEMDASNAKQFEYDTDDWLYKVRENCFWAKIVLTGTVALLLMATLFTKLA